MIVKHHCKSFKFVIVVSICNPINIYGCNIAQPTKSRAMLVRGDTKSW